MLYHKLFRELSRNLRYIFFLTVCTKASGAGMHHLLEALVDALQQQAEYLLPVRPDLGTQEGISYTMQYLKVNRLKMYTIGKF